MPNEERHIKENNPTAEELRTWQQKSGLLLKKFFNTSGLVYKDMKLSTKLPTMSEEDQLALLATGLRVIQKFYPLLENTDDMSLIINISSEAGSISKCYRKFYVDYGMAKAALNMGTMTIWNNLKDNEKVNIFAVHPGWIRTNGQADNPAPLSSYEAAEILRKLFEERRYDKKGHRFITNEGVDYPF